MASVTPALSDFVQNVATFVLMIVLAIVSFFFTVVVDVGAGLAGHGDVDGESVAVIGVVEFDPATSRVESFNPDWEAPAEADLSRSTRSAHTERRGQTATDRLNAAYVPPRTAP